MGEVTIRRWWLEHPPTRPLDATELRYRTGSHWRSGGSEEKRVQRYIEDLLPDELRYADARGALPDVPCETLALLVGYSLEPLLQVISVFQPGRIVLLLSQRYGSEDSRDRQTGRQRGEDVREWIVNGLVPRLARKPQIELKETADTPDAVFGALCEKLLADQRAGTRIIVDITGAKKSMDAGAFLFAAYADIPICYVDFDDYDEENRRPFGFLCRIGLLSNPYHAFDLRNWEDVQRAYERYHFRSAIAALQGILAEMREPRFTQPQILAAKTLLDVLAVYEAWDDGDHSRARNRLRALPAADGSLTFPSAIDTLGPVWPDTSSVATSDASALAGEWLRSHDALLMPPHHLLLSNPLLVTYSHDELAKINRLLRSNEDNRSAFLRAMGLDELLLKARWARLWEAQGGQHVAVWRPNANQPCWRADLDAAEQAEIRKNILEYSDPHIMRQALQRGHQAQAVNPRSWAESPHFGLNIGRQTYELRPTRLAPRLAAYETNVILSVKTLKRLRNQAIHMFLYIEQTLAKSGVDLAIANLHEFEESWTALGRDPSFSSSSILTEHIPWRQLTRACELDFLPLAR